MYLRKLHLRLRQHVQIETENVIEYNSDLQMYNTPPTGNITIEEFENLALERLQLLKILENVQQEGHKRYSKSWKTHVQLKLEEINLQGYLNLLGFTNNKATQEARRADHISHWILCVAIGCCKELHDWFMIRELELLKMRCDALSNSERLQFLRDNNFECTPISQQEKHRLKSELLECTKRLQCFDQTDFYTIPFTKVRSLVKTRGVYLKNSIAYVPDYALWALPYDAFNIQLGEVLVVRKCYIF